MPILNILDERASIMKNVLLKSAVLAISAMLLTSCAVGSDSEIREVGFYEVESEDSQAILQEFRIILLDSKNNFLDGEFSEYSTATNVETGVTEKVKKLYNYRYPFEQISIFEIIFKFWSILFWPNLNIEDEAESLLEI